MRQEAADNGPAYAIPAGAVGLFRALSPGAVVFPIAFPRRFSRMPLSMLDLGLLEAALSVFLGRRLTRVLFQETSSLSEAFRGRGPKAPVSASILVHNVGTVQATRPLVGSGLQGADRSLLGCAVA